MVDQKSAARVGAENLPLTSKSGASWQEPPCIGKNRVAALTARVSGLAGNLYDKETA
jgi:hypothetical protein